MASAASVPGSGRRCSSATRAVRLRNGSTTTSRAPLLARVEQLAPQVRRGRQRVPAPDEQVAGVRPLLRVDLGRDAVRHQRAGDSRRSRRSCARAPTRRARSSPGPLIDVRPGSAPACPCSCTAGSTRRRTRRAPASRPPRRRWSSASSHEARRKLAALAHQRVQDALVRVDAVEVVRDLAAEEADGDRVVGIARRP